MSKCKYCGEDTAIRNPTGKCDHLHYPENCQGYKNEQKANRPKLSEEKVLEIIERYIILPRGHKVMKNLAKTICNTNLWEE